MQSDLSPYRWVILSLLGGAIASRILVGISLGILLPDITETYGLDAVQQGWLGSAMNLGNVALGLPGAWLLSRYNPRALITLSLGISAILTFSQGLAPAFLFLLSFRICTGLTFVSMSPARTLLVQQWFPLREIVLVNGINIAVVGVVEAVGMTFTPYLLVALGSWQNVMHSFGMLGMVTTLTWLLFGRHQAPERTAAAPLAAPGSPMLVLLRHPVLWIVALGHSTAPGFWWAYATFWPTYMLETFNMPLTLSGFLFGLTSLGMAPAGLFFGWACSRWPSLRRPVLWGCGLGLSSSAIAMLFTDSVPALFVICLIGGFSWGFNAVISSIPYELPGVQPREVAIAASFVWTAGSLGGLLGPTIAGMLIAQWQNTALALGVLALLALGVSLCGFALKSPQPTRA